MNYMNDNMKVNIGDIVHISTVDWHGRSACTIFFNGCSFRCIYCQNHKLIDRKKFMYMSDIEKDITDSQPFVSAIVFSGGEPTVQADAIMTLAKFIKNKGLLVGIQTNGYFPDVVRMLIENDLVDKIFFDVKIDPLNQEKYSKIVGNIYDASHKIVQTFDILNSLDMSDIDIEIRTTIFRCLNDSVEIAKYLVEHDYNGIYVIQQGVPWNTLNNKIRKEDILKRRDIISIANCISNDIGLKKIKIRTIEKGEEYIM